MKTNKNEYTVGNYKFYTKKQISSFARKLMMLNIDKEFENDDFLFFKDLTKYHEHNYDINTIEKIYPIYVNDNINLMVRFKNLRRGKHISYKTIEKPVSVYKCIKNIPTYTIIKTYKPFIFPFGKYKGKSIEEINDVNYLYYLLGWDQLSQYTRKQINAFLKISRTMANKKN